MSRVFIFKVSTNFGFIVTHSLFDNKCTFEGNYHREDDKTKLEVLPSGLSGMVDTS